MTEIVKISKEREFVVFYLSNGKEVRYNLATAEYIGTQGKKVDKLTGQFHGAKLYEVEHLFEDKQFYAYLKALDNMDRYENFRRRNRGSIATALNRASCHRKLEGYVRLGISADEKIHVSVSELPRDMLTWIRKSNAYTARTPLRDKHVILWKRNATFLQSAMTRYDDYPEFITGLTKTILDGYSAEEGLYDLIDKYGYKDYPALVEYLHNISEYEAVPIDNLLRDLADYNRMQKIMTRGAKYEKYPRCFLTTDRITQRNYERLKSAYDKEAFELTYDERLEWEHDGYVFICPKEPDQIKDEAVQQQHCVASYIPQVIEGRCHIIFMRKKEEKETSLVTLEYRNGKILQARGRLNRSVTPGEREIINRYEALVQKRKERVAA